MNTRQRVRPTGSLDCPGKTPNHEEFDQPKIEGELLRSLDTELNRIFKKHGFRCNNYLYVTNLDVSNGFRSKANKVFDDFFGSIKRSTRKPNFAVIEYKDLEPYIAENQFIKRAFPSLLSFTDLESVFLKKEETKNKGYIKQREIAFADSFRRLTIPLRQASSLAHTS